MYICSLQNNIKINPKLPPANAKVYFVTVPKPKEGKIMKKVLVLFAVAMFATGIVTAADAAKDAKADAKALVKDAKADAKADVKDAKKDAKALVKDAKAEAKDAKKDAKDAAKEVKK